MAFWVVPAYFPEIKTFVFDDTLWVLTVNLALVCPAATVTLDGTVATDVLPLESDTLVPPEGAAALRVAVPVELLPPLMLVGLRVREESVKAGLMIARGRACSRQPGPGNHSRSSRAPTALAGRKKGGTTAPAAPARPADKRPASNATKPRRS